MARHLSSLEFPDPGIDDRDRKASPGSSVPAATSEADQAGTEPPAVRHALRAIVKLLARQAARDHMAQGECP